MKMSLSSRFQFPWLPLWARARRESDVHPHVLDEHAELFSAHNGASTELEVLNWLYASIRAFKLPSILETGAANGLGTIAMATACKHNGFGVVHAVELEPGTCRSLRRKAALAGVSRFLRIHCRDSLSFLAETELSFDLAFFDSLCELRAREFRTCLERGLIGRMSVFHDTSPRRCLSLPDRPDAEAHARYRDEIRAFASDPRCGGIFESVLSRGLICLFLKGESMSGRAPR